MIYNPDISEDFFLFHKDAFSNGQMRSKLWLCQELENLFNQIDNIWIYGGWYGTTGLFLRVRNNIKIKKIFSYDIDPSCEPVADVLNENWVYKEWAFKAFTEDCNVLTPEIGNPDLIINTSTEHFGSMDWWHNIPQGMMVALQGNNMSHDDHYACSANLREFKKKFQLTEILYEGKLDFKYPNWQFSRFMLIGIK